MDVSFAFRIRRSGYEIRLAIFLCALGMLTIHDGNRSELFAQDALNQSLQPLILELITPLDVGGSEPRQAERIHMSEVPKLEPSSIRRARPVNLPYDAAKSLVKGMTARGTPDNEMEVSSGDGKVDEKVNEKVNELKIPLKSLATRKLAEKNRRERIPLQGQASKSQPIVLLAPQFTHQTDANRFLAVIPELGVAPSLSPAVPFIDVQEQEEIAPDVSEHEERRIPSNDLFDITDQLLETKTAGPNPVKAEVGESDERVGEPSAVGSANGEQEYSEARTEITTLNDNNETVTSQAGQLPAPRELDTELIETPESMSSTNNEFVAPQLPEPNLVIGDLRDAWLMFEDPALKEMIERVILQNPGLREAKARILESRAMFNRATADLFPQVTATAQHGYRRFSQNGNAFVQDSTTTQGFDWYSSGFDTRWEVDLFGRLRGIRNAANFEALAAEQSYRDVMVTLIGDLMLSYVEFALATERIRIAQQNLVVQLDILELTKERLRIGEDGELSVAQARTQVELTRASLPALKEQRSVALNRLLLLQGVGAQYFHVPKYWGQQLPTLPTTAPRSIDCELLARRPDVRSSRLLVSAQLERLGASKAEYYPQVFINGTISLETRDLDIWWDEQSVAHSVGPVISLNLLDFGRIRANIRSERAKYEQAVSRYRQSVLDATEEVRNAMVGVERQRERADGLTVAAESAYSVIEMARLEYKEGVTNFQNVLDAQRQLLNIEDQRAVAHGTALISYARLFKALGGVWYENPEDDMSSIWNENVPVIDGP